MTYLIICQIENLIKLKIDYLGQNGLWVVIKWTFNQVPKKNDMFGQK
jgi:hypothetical protein